MIIEIALGILLAYVLIATMRYWLPFLLWSVVGAVCLASAFVAFLVIT